MKQKDAILDGSLKGEEFSSIFRGCLALIGLIYILLIRDTLTPRAIFVGYVACSVLAVHCIIIAAFIRIPNIYQSKWFRLVQYLSSTIDVAIVSWGLWAAGGGIRIFKSYIFLTYFIFVIFAAYRYSRSLTLYTAALSIGVYISMFLFAVRNNMIAIGTVSQEYGGPYVSLAGMILKLLILVLAAVSLSFNTSHISKFMKRKRKLFKNTEQQLQKSYKIRTILQRYLSKNLVTHILDTATDVAPERIKASVLFVDFRNFSQISVAMGLEDIAHYLNIYLSKIADIVLAHNGIVDKYTGDGLMAVFRDTASNGGESCNAVRTALEIKTAIDRFNEHNKDILYNQYQNSAVLHDLEVGMAINTGDVIAGSIGSEQRKEYTVIGPAVNLAARLGNMNKKLGVTILISDNTYKDSKDQVKVALMGRYRIRGFDNSIKIYELVEWKDHTPSAVSDGTNIELGQVAMT